MILLANGEGGVGVAAALAALRDGGSALNAVEAGIRVVEADPTVRSVGKGGAPNLRGEVECDAAIMDGATLQCGAVGALQGYLHAISVARQVMERLPHVFLAGEGAAIFAQEIGAEPDDLLTEDALGAHARWLKQHVPAGERVDWPWVPLAPHAWTSAETVRTRGTTVYLAMDNDGRLAGGTSTSGWAQKYPGRLGDSPVIGAGLYADGRYGACGCTHTGELAIRAGTARSVVLYMKKGATVQEACHEAVADLGALQGGLVGPLVIHAVDRHGEPCVVSTRDMGERIVYTFWRDGMRAAEIRRPEVMEA
jgi:beta-aspartyl-peptidase (threonine type)